MALPREQVVAALADHDFRSRGAYRVLILTARSKREIDVNTEEFETVASARYPGTAAVGLLHQWRIKLNRRY